MTHSGMEPKQTLSSVIKHECRELVARAMTTILSTEIAHITFAQIVDGVPLPSVLEDTHAGSDFQPDHPLFAHDTLCPDVLEKTTELLKTFDIGNLKFNASLLHALQANHPESESFTTRFIEIIAVAVHEVAKHLYMSDSRGHQDGSIEKWVPPKNEAWDWWWRQNPDGPPATLFQHRYYYLDHDKYPDGVADTVGYWAESRILGGVILFNRKAKPASDSVFIHPDRDYVTYRICELTEEQKTSLIRFSLAPPSETLGRDRTPCPLPITPDLRNTNRVDPEEPISWTGVYRDIWEREIHTDELGDRRCRDVWSKADEMDWITFDLYQEARGRYFSRFDRYPGASPISTPEESFQITNMSCQASSPYAALSNTSAHVYLLISIRVIRCGDDTASEE